MSYQFQHKTTPKAKKEHKCFWCGTTIKIGEKHIKWVGLYEDFSSNRWHDKCYSTYVFQTKAKPDFQLVAYNNPKATGHAAEYAAVATVLIDHYDNNKDTRPYNFPYQRMGT